LPGCKVMDTIKKKRDEMTGFILMTSFVLRVMRRMLCDAKDVRHWWPFHSYCVRACTCISAGSARVLCVSSEAEYKEIG